MKSRLITGDRCHRGQKSVSAPSLKSLSCPPFSQTPPGTLVAPTFTLSFATFQESECDSVEEMFVEEQEQLV